MNKKKSNFKFIYVLAIFVLLSFSFYFLYAYVPVYAEGEYSITYDLDGGVLSVDNVEQYTEEDTFTLNNPTKEGYDFIGWSGSQIDGLSLEVTIPVGSTGDREYSANWQAIEYDITYNLDGGENNENNVSTYTIEDEIELSSPTKTGYTFNGWYLEGTFENKIEKIDIGSTGDITLYAKYSIDIYTITYNLDGGENNENNVSTYTIEDEVDLLSPTKFGYTFDGWYLEGTFENKIEKIDIGSIGNITLYAKFNVNSYQITYNANGGIIDSLTQEVTYGASYELIFPTKVGYEFLGYTLNGEDFVKENNYYYEDITLVAKWQALEYEITYVLDNSINSNLNVNNFTIEDEVILYDAQKDGYTFNGWYLEETFENKIENIEIGTHEDITIYAEFVANIYEATFNGYEGIIYVTYDESYTLTPVSENGLTFVGWMYNDVLYTNRLGASKNVWKFTENIEFTPSWNVNRYNITYNVEDDVYVENKSYEVLFGDDYTLDIPKKSGYVFDGWEYSSALITDEFGNSLTAWSETKNIEVEPTWIKIEVEIEDSNVVFENAINTTFSLTFNVYPLNSSDLQFSSSNEDIFIVDENGKITCVGLGRAKIRCTAVNGGSYDECECLSASIRLDNGNYLIFIDIDKDENQRYAVLYGQSTLVGEVLDKIVEFASIERKCVIRDPNDEYLENDASCIENFNEGDIASLNQFYRINKILGKVNFTLENLEINSTLIECEYNQKVKLKNIKTLDERYSVGKIFVNSIVDVEVYQVDRMFNMPAADVEVGVSVSSIILQSSLDATISCENGFYPSTTATITKIKNSEIDGVVNIPNDRNVLISYKIEFDSENDINEYTLKIAVPKEIQKKDGVYVVFNNGVEDLMTQVRYDGKYAYIDCVGAGSYVFVSKAHEPPYDLSWLVIMLGVFDGVMLLVLAGFGIYVILLKRKYNNMYSLSTIMPFAFILSAVVGGHVAGSIILGLIFIIEILLCVYIPRKIKNYKLEYEEILKSIQNSDLEENEQEDENSEEENENNID